MLVILWHISQHKPPNTLKHEVVTCAFTGGVAMLIHTPDMTPMMTCWQFQIEPKDPRTTAHAVTFMTNNTMPLCYVFIDEFLFLSYRHLKDIVD